MQLVGECPVPEFRRVRAVVDVCRCAVRERDLMDSFVEVGHSFLLCSAGCRSPEISGRGCAGAGLLLAEVGRLAVLRVADAVRGDEVTV